MLKKYHDEKYVGVKSFRSITKKSTKGLNPLKSFKCFRTVTTKSTKEFNTFEVSRQKSTKGLNPLEVS